MSYAEIPNASKSQIKKAGELLVAGADNSSRQDYEWALDLANQWRACHAYPINTFNVTLRKAIASLPGEPIAAQRLKRMPTIIDKLRRYPAMNLTTMQDIAGVRAILNSVDDVYKIADQYRNNKYLAHEKCPEKNHIDNPRDQDGYRSLHLIFKYNNKRAKRYKGLRVEMQLRTKLQHNWATAVETMGTFLGQALKSRKGNQAWLDFFALVSTAFAHMEKTPLPSRFGGLSKNDTANAVRESNRKLGAIDTMRGISAIVPHIVPSRASFFHLIVLDSSDRSVRVTAYERERIEQAMSDYLRTEKDAVAGKLIEPVLVSAGPLAKLRKAYSSFFLDIEEFIKTVEQIIDGHA